MLLADSAQAVDGKLYVLGGGWSITGPGPAPSAIAIKIDVPWDRANQKHKWKLTLLTEDGHPVELETPAGKQTVEIGGEFEVGRPAGLTPGTPIDLSLAVNISPLPLPPASRLVWQLTIDNESDVDWRLPFGTRPAPTG